MIGSQDVILSMEFYFGKNVKKNFFFFILTFFCRNYTSRPRMSGTSGGYELVQILYNSWKSFGIDEVKVAPYDVLMSYPNRTNPNRVRSCIFFYMTPPKKRKKCYVLLNYDIIFDFYKIRWLLFWSGPGTTSDVIGRFSLSVGSIWTSFGFPQQ